MDRVILALLSFVVFSGLASAQQSVSETQAFVEERAAAVIESGDVAGLVIAVVRPDGSAFTHAATTKGVQFPQPLDGGDSIVQIASISKTFTAVAMMQLVERGLVELDAPVSTYLPEQAEALEGDFGVVTVKDLFAHRAGYEPIQYPIWPKTAADVMSLSEYLQLGRPARVFNAGETTIYSNYSYGLAGLIIERVTKQNYADYLENEVLRPLGMLSTTTRQPGVSAGASAMRAELERRIAPGQYQSADGYKPRSYVYSNNVPAGSVATTAEDMIKFMKAFLFEPSLDEKTVVSKLAKDVMTSKLFEDRPGGADYGMGFEHRPLGGHDMIGHEGDIFYTKSYFGLLPDAQAGVYVSVLSNNGRDIAISIVEETLLEIAGKRSRQDLIDPPVQQVAPLPFKERMIFEYRSHTTFEKLFLIAFETFDFELDEAGALRRHASNETFKKITPFLFENEETGERIYLQADDTGFVERVYVGSFPMVRPSFFSNPSVLVLVAGASGLVAIFGIILSSLSVFNTSSKSKNTKFLAPTLLGLSIVITASSVLLGYAVATFSGSFPDSMIDYPTTPIKIAVYWNYILIPAFLIAAIVIAFNFKSPQGILLRTFQVTAAPLFLLYILVAYQWNLIGPNFLP
ncbi:MAG: serine hydrolase domain-containing protein [Pseudomonadota bacterium]